MKPKFQSAYQKMYLVTPGVYEKLKICIVENEKTVGILPSNIQSDEFMSALSTSKL